MCRISRLLTVAACALLTTPAWADCDPGSATVFHCTTTKGKVLQLCDAGKTMVYSFGLPQRTPDIVLRVPRARASTWQWNGTGPSMSYSVNIPNGNTTYSVFWSVDRMTDEHPISAGVHVTINGKHAATVSCVGEVQQALEGIDLPLEK